MVVLILRTLSYFNIFLPIARPQTLLPGREDLPNKMNIFSPHGITSCLPLSLPFRLVFNPTGFCILHSAAS